MPQVSVQRRMVPAQLKVDFFYCLPFAFLVSSSVDGLTLEHCS